MAPQSRLAAILGVVIARVVNTGSSADYLDEATQAGKDLNAELFAMEVVSQPNSTVTVNLNVLSTLAYHKVQDAAAGSLPAESMVNDINNAVADLFGLPSLHGTTVVPTNGGAFHSANGLSAGEIYGAVLAALIGVPIVRTVAIAKPSRICLPVAGQQRQGDSDRERKALSSRAGNIRQRKQNRI